jgi:hypothetical protein
MTRDSRRILACFASAAILLLARARVPIAQEKTDAGSANEWTARSNQNARLLLEVLATYAPERAARLGVMGLDEQITQLSIERRAQAKADLHRVTQALQDRLSGEEDPRVAQDLRILIKAAEDSRTAIDLDEKYDVPYFNVPELVFGGLRALLDDQLPPERRRAALVRLRKYAGVEPGYRPITEQAKARTVEGRRPGQLGPDRVEVETNLARDEFFVNGIRDLLIKYQIEGYQDAFARLGEQLTAYNAWVRQEILPLARTDFRQPAEKYAFAFRQYGIDIPPGRLAADAHQAFDRLQQKMAPIAARTAKTHGWASTDYRDVIRELKKDQLVGEAILPHYEQRLKEIEAVIRRERLVTLPARPARIRLATPAETAQQPAPHMDSPPLVNNTGQHGEFVLPLQAPAPGSAQTARMDDFTFAAASWTLTAHEARPGHELQFDAMVERGVSLARSIFAFNSVNVEGWGLYAEQIMEPYEPVEGQLITLQLRLMRAARAFLDPELQAGKLTPDEARRILTRDVVLSESFANTEIERYTFRAPGQAASYFYGYSKLLDLRREVEARMGRRFDQQAFHDFVLGQGLLPPDLLRSAVLDRYAAPREGLVPRPDGFAASPR